MTGGGFTVLDSGTDPTNDAGRFSGIAYIRGPSWARFPLLTIGLLGVQLFWSIEMSYAPPYLLSLGLSKSSMAIVFLAGPLSGLVVQPLIGVLADSNTSRWGRRRPYMMFGTTICMFAMLLLGWTKQVAGWFSSNASLTLWLAVLSIFLIDFSINAVQAVDRALLVDTLPSSEQPSANAWAARMLGFGSVVGFFVGNLDLPSALPFLGKTEIQVLSILVSFLLLASHLITAAGVNERVLLKVNGPGVGGPLAKSFTQEVKDIFTNLWTLPRVIRQICIIQFFSWIAWFPILFYTTMYIGDLHKKAFYATMTVLPPSIPSITGVDGSNSTSALPDSTLESIDAESTRLGARALFYSSLLSLAVNLLLPFFVTEASESSRRRKRLRQHQLENENGDLRTAISRGGRRWWKELAIPEVIKVHLASLWAASNAVLAGCMFATFFTSSIGGATLLITVTGFSWAITQWAPFALLAEAILTESPPGSLDDADGGSIRLTDTRRHRRSSSLRASISVARRDSNSHRGSRDQSGDAGRPSEVASRRQSVGQVARVIVPEDDNDADDEGGSTQRHGDHVADGAAGAGVNASAGPMSAGEDDGASLFSDTESEEGYRVRKEQKERRKRMILGSEGGGVSKVEGRGGRGTNYEHEDDEDEGEEVVLIGRSTRDAEQGGDSDTDLEDLEGSNGSLSSKAGIILGIHNIFIVIPQFLVTGLSSIIFAILDPDRSVVHGSVSKTRVPTNGSNVADAVGRRVLLLLREEGINATAAEISEVEAAGTSNSVAYIFRVGGVSALIAFILCWQLARELRHR